MEKLQQINEGQVIRRRPGFHIGSLGKLKTLATSQTIADLIWSELVLNGKTNTNLSKFNCKN